MDHVYELTKIIREKGNYLADDARIGRKYVPTKVERGFPALLVHADNVDLALLTSPVKHVYSGIVQLLFATENTTYVLRRVDV
jgi:hypothetical protein